MTLEQLRSIFHVESQDLVPHYEVIHLTHHGTTEHKVSKRSIATASSIAKQQHQNNQFNDATIQHKSYSHHVKKDLSKSAYYSELKQTIHSTLPVSSKSALRSTNSIMNSDLNHTNSNNNSFSSNNNQTKLVENSLRNRNSEHPSENQYKSQFTLPSKLTPARERDDSDSDEQTKRNKPIAQLDLANIKEHNVSLSVFGQVLNLTLRPTTQLFKNGPQSLQMFSVNVSPNATHGLSYEPIKEVSFQFFFCFQNFFFFQFSIYAFIIIIICRVVRLNFPFNLIHSFRALPFFFCNVSSYVLIVIVILMLDWYKFVSDVYFLTSDD